MARPEKRTGTGPRKDDLPECGVEALSANHDAHLFFEGARASLCESGIADSAGVVSMTPDQAAAVGAMVARTRILMQAFSSSSAKVSEHVRSPHSMSAPARGITSHLGPAGASTYRKWSTPKVFATV
ncbi:MAG: hypothetical protein OXE86_06200 [Alphaproteobacteria bacterium]|nr:hypothetical protein [Alphaproteobacteria bacterium]